MNEEEIIKRLTKPKKYTLIEILRKFKRDGIENYIITKPELLQGLLDLYNKEKERNKDLEQIEKEHKEENGRLRDKIKELEKIDLTTVYMDGFYDGEKKWKDKIQNKIQEINNKPQYPECIEGNENDIRLLQELLEESEK